MQAGRIGWGFAFCSGPCCSFRPVTAAGWIAEDAEAAGSWKHALLNLSSVLLVVHFSWPQKFVWYRKSSPPGSSLFEFFSS